MAKCIALLEETASQTLKVQITADGLYRYCLEEKIRASLNIRMIVNSVMNQTRIILNSDYLDNKLV